jgi:hypothetical protein
MGRPHARRPASTRRPGQLKAAAATVTIAAFLTGAATGASHARHDGGRLVRGFMCIHRHEGAWNDPGAPYYGGLQMDYEFQRSYGREFLQAFGTADRWPPAVQIAVAIRAYLSGRGWYPWPNTARMCGLL